MGKDADGKVKNHIIMAKTKTEERQKNDGQMSPKKKKLVRYPFYFVETIYQKKSVEGYFQNKILTAVRGTESTVKTDTRKIINQKFFRTHYFRPNEERKGSRQSTQAPKSTRRIDIVYGAWTASTDAGTKYSVIY